MATKFTLSQSKSKALPEAVEVDGSAFSIDSSFRTVLNVLRMLDDTEIVDAHRPALLTRWFYRGRAPRDARRAYDAFSAFVRMGEDDAARHALSKRPVFDYEQDAQEIYSSFMSLYGIDLFEADLHWWQFSALLDGAFRCPCALSSKIEIRRADPSKCENPAAVREAQDLIQITAKTSRAERAERERVQEILTSGGDVAAALEAYKNGV